MTTAPKPTKFFKVPEGGATIRILPHAGAPVRTFFNHHIPPRVLTMARVRDAPPRVWAVRTVMPDDLSQHKRLVHGTYQPVIYAATQRKDGFHVWALASALGPKVAPERTYASTAAALAAGKRYAKGIEYVDDVRAFDLAPRLGDIVRDAGHRSAVRLGEGWRYVLLTKLTETERGPRYLFALGEHDGERPDKKAKITQAGWAHLNVTLLQRLGRLNQRQATQLEHFAATYGIRTVTLSYMPRTPGKPIPRKHLPTM